jgi:hypothetical protein
MSKRKKQLMLQECIILPMLRTLKKGASKSLSKAGTSLLHGWFLVALILQLVSTVVRAVEKDQLGS